MKHINGNITAYLQVYVNTINEIGESVNEWYDVTSFNGYLDLSTGSSNRNSYNTKLQESTHEFLCDYKPIEQSIKVDGKTIPINQNNTRMVIKGVKYEVLLIDNPMELNYHYEILLKLIGSINE